MSRRDWPLRKACEHPGCKEVAHWRFDTQRELRESYAARNPYRCARHSEPDKVLSMERRRIVHSVDSFRGAADKLYWAGALASGLIYGPGFKAFAEDFPEGTRLLIEVTVLPPGSGLTTCDMD